MRHFRRAWLLFALIGLLAGGLVLDASRADEEPLDDGADGEVPFGERVNRAIDQGSKWLLAKPDLFTDGKADMAHWGLIRAARVYGGGEGEGYGHPAGVTAFALYTLLKCGVDPDHEVVQRGFNWLREEHAITKKYDGTAGGGSDWRWSHLEGRGSYELSAEILALTAKYDQYKRTKNTKLRRSKGKLKIRDRVDREWLQLMVAALVARRGLPATGAAREDRRGWRYNLREIKVENKRGGGAKNFPRGPMPPHANQDLSSTQLAALALYSAHQFSVVVDPEVWVDIGLLTLSHQEEDGPVHERHAPGYRPDGEGPPKDRARGFMYIKGSPDNVEGIATGSITACGIANLLMVKDVLHESKKGKKLWSQAGFEQRLDQAMYDGIAWLAVNWSSFRNPKAGGQHLYYLYAVERAMDLRGKQLVGKHVWYNEGAKEILDRQKPVKVKDVTTGRDVEIQGTFWDTSSTHKPSDVLDSCFALLFLKRATAGLAPTVTED